MSESNETAADWPPVRRRRLSLGALRRHRLLVVSLPVLAAAALAAGLIIAADDAPPSRAAALAPSDATVFVHARRDADAARLWEIAGDFPSLAALERGLLGPDVDPQRDIAPWLGDELALALPGPLLLAAVADRAGAERFRRRLPETTASAYAGAFLAIGPNAAVNAAAARAGGEGESLADTRAYQRAGEIERAPVELYAPADGIRRLLAEAPALLRAAGAFADSPQFEGIAAGVVPEERGLRIRARIQRAPGGPPAEEFAPALPGRVPASAAAFLDLPGADALTALLERGGLAATVSAVRAALPEIAGVDLDRDLLGPLGSEAALTIGAEGATPEITLTARTDDPALTREALARLQGPLTEQLAPGSAGFRALDGDAFTLAATPRLEPSYAVTGNVVVASTHRSGLAQRTLARRGLAQDPAFRAVANQTGARVEALAFADLRQLLALGERTGLTLGSGFPATRDDLRQVRAVGAVVRREEADSTAELFLEIP